MFLTVKDYTIPDFLTALGFIAPKGMSVDYILAPDSIKPEAQNQIEAEGYVEQPALDLTNVKYLKKDLKQTHSFSPKANQIEDPNLLPPEMPKAAPVPMDPNLGNNNQIMTPKRGIIIAECVSTDYEKSFILRESFCGIPRNTMIVFHEENEKTTETPETKTPEKTETPAKLKESCNFAITPTESALETLSSEIGEDQSGADYIATFEANGQIPDDFEWDYLDTGDGMMVYNTTREAIQDWIDDNGLWHDVIVEEA